MKRRIVILALTVGAIGLGAAGVAVVWAIHSSSAEATESAQAAAAARKAVLVLRVEIGRRRHQGCLLFERTHESSQDRVARERRRLQTTLDYLASLNADEADNTLNRAVANNVPQVRADLEQARAEAIASRAPPYCDAPGIGLPEPAR